MSNNTIAYPNPGMLFCVSEGVIPHGPHWTYFLVNSVSSDIITGINHCSSCDAPHEWRLFELTWDEWKRYESEIFLIHPGRFV